MKILIACEESQSVYKEFRKLGDGETKVTCLWLKNLQKITPTNIVERSKPYQGIAEAFADQWSD